MKVRAPVRREHLLKPKRAIRPKHHIIFPGLGETPVKRMLKKWLKDSITSNSADEQNSAPNSAIAIEE